MYYKTKGERTQPTYIQALSQWVQEEQQAGVGLRSSGVRRKGAYFWSELEEWETLIQCLLAENIQEGKLHPSRYQEDTKIQECSSPMGKTGTTGGSEIGSYNYTKKGCGLVVRA